MKTGEHKIALLCLGGIVVLGAISLFRVIQLLVLLVIVSKEVK